MGLCFLWFFVQELSKAQPAVVLVLKRLRRRGNGLKSHPTDWEKQEIEPATPGLQDIGLSPSPRPLLKISFSLSDFPLSQSYKCTHKIIYILIVNPVKKKIEYHLMQYICLHFD